MRMTTSIGIKITDVDPKKLAAYEILKKFGNKYLGRALKNKRGELSDVVSWWMGKQRTGVWLRLRCGCVVYRPCAKAKGAQA